MELLYYLSHWLWKRRVPVLPRLIMIVIRLIYQSYIPYNVEIGPGIKFGHKLGIVINSTAKIGANVKIRHFVGIGGGSVTIDDDVEIGAGARISGKIHIGKGSLIGANAVVLKDVPAHVTVAGVPAKIVRWHKNNEKSLDGQANQKRNSINLK